MKEERIQENKWKEELISRKRKVGITGKKGIGRGGNKCRGEKTKGKERR